MNFLKNIFGKKDARIRSNEDFWNWFKANEKAFFNAVKSRTNIEKDFFDHLMPKLNELKKGYFFLSGMSGPDTAELVLTADGDIRNIAFVEDLIASAPKLDGWLFTALKPPMDIKNVIQMGDYHFSGDNLFFYPEEIEGYPDEISIKVIHQDMNDTNSSQIIDGTYIFLDNFLGELELATTVDDLAIIPKSKAEKELIPIEKLKAYLIWREKEFVERYQGIRHDTENDSYSSFEAELQNGNKLLAIINMDLLEWDSKASHPWILNVEVKYDGSRNNGMPDNATYQLLNFIEDEIADQLKDSDGYLNVGRQTADGSRDIYFACRDFRKPSKVMYAMQQKYPDITFEIYKDKYWRSFDRFRN